MNIYRIYDFHERKKWDILIQAFNYLKYNLHEILISQNRKRKIFVLFFLSFLTVIVLE